MAMTIRNNIMSLSILNMMNRTQTALYHNMLHIATGRRINSAADDPSGYAIMQRMDMEIRCLGQASSNAQRGHSMLKTAEGAVSSTVDILKTLKEKALAAANSTATDEDRRIMQKEMDQLVDQIDDNALVTFNGQYMLEGSHESYINEDVTESFTNRSLSDKVTAGSALSSLQRRDGQSLNIQSTDTVTISYVHQGKTYTTSFQAGSSTLSDIFTHANGAGGGTVFAAPSFTSLIGTDGSGNAVYTVDGKAAVTAKAAKSGTDAAVSGFTISIADKTGKSNKAANAVLDAFSESLQAKDKSAGDGSVYLQTGTRAGQGIKASLGDMRSAAFGLKGTDGRVLSITSRESANAAINVLDNALARALDQETTIGAVESRLDYTVRNLTTQSENLTAALSVIADADLAKEITEFAKNNILLQAAQAMLAQSNQNSAWILNLLK